MFVLVHTRLLNKRDLVHAHFLKFLEMTPHVIRRSDATPGTSKGFRDV